MELRFGADSRLVQMGKSVWRGSSLARIVIPKFMEILAPSCFKGSNLQSITFESGSRLWRIGESAFQGSELWYIEIPSSVRAIGASAFAETALMSIIIPQSVEELGAECFSRCKSLKEVILGSWIHLRKVGSTDVSDWHPTTVQRIVKECCCSELTRVIGR
jgi:hypothetical protein